MVDYFVSYITENGNFGNAQVTLPHHICDIDDIKEVSEKIKQMLDISDTVVVLFYKEMIAE